MTSAKIALTNIFWAK